jgi:hypothetical protein
VAAAIVLAAVEALSGTRPLTQLTRWVTADIFEQLNARVPARPPSTRQRATIRSNRVSQVSAHTAEVSVVVHDGGRVRAAAVRLQVHRTRWRATVLQIG